MCMAIEDELWAALLSRAELLLGAADTCLREALLSPTNPGRWLSSVRAERDVGLAEALEAGILTRCGASWDVLASRQNQTRQALHRRLAALSDDLVSDAPKYEAMHTEGAQWKVEAILLWVESEEVRSLIEDPRAFYGKIAGLLARLRRQRLWWAMASS